MSTSITQPEYTASLQIGVADMTSSQSAMRKPLLVIPLASWPADISTWTGSYPSFPRP